MKMIWPKLKQWWLSGVPYLILVSLAYSTIASLSMLTTELMLLSSTPWMIAGFFFLEAILISSTLIGYFTGRIHEINIKQRHTRPNT